MPVASRRDFIIPNVVKNLPTLPVSMVLGKISVNLRFQDHPSASLEYEAIHQNDIGKYERAYNPKNQSRISLYGIPFRVRRDGGYSYSREEYVYKGNTYIDIYRVKVELEGFWKELCQRKIKLSAIAPNRKTINIFQLASKVGVSYSGISFDIPVENNDQSLSLNDVLPQYALINGCYLSYSNSSVTMQPLDSTRSWNFSNLQIIEDGSNVLGSPDYYNESEITFGDFSEKTSYYLIEPIAQFQQKDPVVKVEVEEDDNIFEPPLNTYVLRGLDSNHDQSGPKKVRKTTTTIDGKPSSEITEIWGFAYNWEDCDNLDQPFLISNPKQFWRQIEYEKREYLYERIPSEPIGLSTQDPQGKETRLIIHPDYIDYVTLHLGLQPTISINSQVEYLTSVVTSGWTYTRPCGEPDPNGDYCIASLNSPFYELMKFRKINRADQIKYYLIPLRTDYGEQSLGSPVDVEWTDWNAISPELRARIINQAGTIQYGEIGLSNNRIGLIKPNLNYVEPMLVWVESRQGSSFAAFPHPENDPKNGVYKEPFITGEESYYQDIWTKVDEEKCRQKIVEFSAQDYGFSSLSEKIKYRRIIGKPPEAQYRQKTWENVGQEKRDPFLSVTSAERTRYFLFSDSIPTNSEITEALNFPLAKNIAEAMLAAKTQLRINSFQGSTTKSATISWFFPQIREGDSATFGKDRFSSYGRWRVLSASFTLDYQGINQNHHGIIATCSGTQLSCGMDTLRSVRVEKREEPSLPPDGSKQGQDPKIATSRKNAATLGGILPTAPGRRMN
ncbi:MAG: hypothetical protein ACRCT1_15510 [Microcoleaceae cyanobacterium]